MRLRFQTGGHCPEIEGHFRKRGVDERVVGLFRKLQTLLGPLAIFPWRRHWNTRQYFPCHQATTSIVVPSTAYCFRFVGADRANAPSPVVEAPRWEALRRRDRRGRHGGAALLGTARVCSKICRRKARKRTLGQSALI